MRFFKAPFIVLLIIGATAALFVWSGIYNIAAAKPHAELVQWLFATLRDRSSPSIAIPSPPAVNGPCADEGGGSCLPRDVQYVPCGTRT